MEYPLFLLLPERDLECEPRFRPSPENNIQEFGIMDKQFSIAGQFASAFLAFGYWLILFSLNQP